MLRSFPLKVSVKPTFFSLLKYLSAWKLFAFIWLCIAGHTNFIFFHNRIHFYKSIKLNSNISLYFYIKLLKKKANKQLKILCVRSFSKVVLFSFGFLLGWNQKLKYKNIISIPVKC